MDVERYIITKAVKTKENVLIPVWDERLIFGKDEECGDFLSVKGEYTEFTQLVECIFDLKTKKIELGIELNYYEDSPFKVGEIVLFEKLRRVLVESKISKIVYEEYHLVIKRGRKIDKWYLEKLNNVEINLDTLYAIKLWKPFYILDDGIKIESEYQLYHKYQNSNNQ